MEDTEPEYPSSLRYRMTHSFLRAVDDGRERHARWCWSEDDRRVAAGIPRAMAWDGVFAPNGER